MSQLNWDRVERLLGGEALAQLGQKKVAIIGLGSGGGFVASSLAMSGIQHFVLVDDDELEPHNLVRHIGGLSDLHKPKVQVAKEHILNRNPQAEIVTIQGRLEAHRDALMGVDLVISGVDGENSKFLINELCLALNLPAIYAGVYERGEGGDVAMIYPYEGPCYACWASSLRDGYIPPMPNSQGELDYGLLNEEGTLDAEPALWLHVVRVAATQADLALNMLLKNLPSHRSMPANTVILANHALEIVEGRLTPPYSAEWVNIPRDPTCLVCGKHFTASTHHLSLDALGDDLLRFEVDEAIASEDKQDE